MGHGSLASWFLSFFLEEKSPLFWFGRLAKLFYVLYKFEKMFSVCIGPLLYSTRRHHVLLLLCVCLLALSTLFIDDDRNFDGAGHGVVHRRKQ